MFTIKKELAQAILNYLADQPFKEVFGLIQELQKLEKIKEEEIKEEEIIK